jgi:hypothetical protein
MSNNSNKSLQIADYWDYTLQATYIATEDSEE